MKIEYSTKSKKFEIRCNYAENGLIADLPSKKFQKRRMVWAAPALARNCEFLLRRLREEMTPEAIEVAEKGMERKRIRRQPFPGWYQFRTNPFKHQRQALDHAWGLEHNAFFMEMGTGKTKVAIDLNSARIMSGTFDVWVVFCPIAIRDNWVDEVRTHCPLTNIPVHVVGDFTKAKERALLKAGGSNQPFIALVGIESLSQKIRGGKVYETLVEMIGDKNFGVTVDESHLIKGHDSNRSRNVQDLAQYAKTVDLMTGTPIAQGIMDLYQPFQVMNPEIIGMGDFYSFRNRYAEMGGYENREVVGYKNVEELMSLIQPYVFQRTKEETLDLPDKLYSRRAVQMSKEQARVYRELDKETESMIKDLARGGQSVEVIVDQVLTKYNALQQITGGFVNYDDESGEEKVRRSAWLVEPEHNPKVKELMAVAAENPGKPVIIWAKFRNEITIIVEALERKYGRGSVSEYHGGLNKDERKASLAAFKSGQTQFFVANQQTGGTGLTVNESNLVVYFSNSLKLVERLQSEDRNHRIGQKNDVVYVDLVCTGTKDVTVLQAIREKRDVAEYVREAMQAAS